MIRRCLPLLLMLLAAPIPAAAQGGAAPAAPGIPEALRGAWFEGGSCAAPDAMLVLTGRAAARIPVAGAALLLRFGSVAAAPGGWTVGTLPGPEARRFVLRSPQPGVLETAEPAAKTRDDRLPGEGAARLWMRCAEPPAALAAPHAEGIAMLAAVEQVEAACAPPAPMRACLAAVQAEADVSRDGALSTAEIARIGRGAAWIAALGAGRVPDAAEAERSARAAAVAARALVDSLDYDGDGRLSASELAQDRAALAAARGTGAGSPLGAPPGDAGEAALLGLHALLTGAAGR